MFYLWIFSWTVHNSLWMWNFSVFYSLVNFSSPCICTCWYFICQLKVLFLNIMLPLLGAIQHLSSFLLTYRQYSLEACKITTPLGLYQHLTKKKSLILQGTFAQRQRKWICWKFILSLWGLKIKCELIVEHWGKKTHTAFSVHSF